MKKIVIALGLFIGGAFTFAGINGFFAHTNRTEFCISCHTMQGNFEEYQDTVHFKNASGVQARCADCHVPREFLPKLGAKIVAIKDVYHEIIGTVDTREKFESHRWEMASRVWERMKSTNSRECRGCHDFGNMDLSAQGRSARKKHARAPMKGKTCIDCHKGIAHLLPDEPDDAPSDNQEADDASTEDSDTEDVAADQTTDENDK